jgi:hypothetical protein
MTDYLSTPVYESVSRKNTGEVGERKENWWGRENWWRASTESTWRGEMEDYLDDVIDHSKNRSGKTLQQQEFNQLAGDKKKKKIGQKT